jgi:hypothetical protein
MAVNDLLTLADIRQYTFYLLEQEGGGGADFWTQDIIDAFISSEHRKLTTVINEAYEEFFTNQATSDIVAGQSLYGLPDDFRKMIRLEWSPIPGTEPYREIIPKQINEQSEFWVSAGTSPSSDGRVQRVSYAFLNTQFRLVPFFSSAVTAGLQMYYTQRLLAPELESWEPFNGLLKDHHELIAVGAAIRGKIREEVDFSGLASLYGELKRELILDIEQRQVQRTKHVRESEGLYDSF